MPDAAVGRPQSTVGDAATVEEVVGRLREIGAALPPADGVAVFNRLYLDVTQAVRDRLGPGYFADPPAMAELDVVFAGRYLRAVAADAAGREPPACWRPLFALRAHPGVHPLQFALAGMSAHIQHDLPLAVVDTCHRRGCGPGDVEEDYHRINGVLADVEAAVREQLMPGPDLLERAEPLTHLLGTWSVEAAREAAWSAVAALWELRHVPVAARAFAAALDCSVGLLGRALLLPLGPGAAQVGPGAAPAGRLPEARNRPAGGSAGPPAGGPAADGQAPPEGEATPGGRPRAGAGAGTGGQAQLECSGLPSA
ncbi:DUF5995 family protein [Streptomyces sp. NRRL S-350]|uniref:DUF5995 family protein n=1 Tax=Streptomyces sp. NRRL S-350 TaxID=1463902 RepID=UPI0007C5B281|nr:DUF5995 family protein [Streptomyces sp. NRRL S-350]